MYDANGNMTTRWYGLSTQQNLTWDHENRLSSISGGGLPTESYLYDADGQRVRKTSNGVNTYYPNQYYEQSGSTITKYQYFNGQRVSMHTNASGGWAHYDLHTDHLGSTVLTTNQGNAVVSNERYFAYGRTRYGGIGVTDQRFTGQKRDGTGLMYFNARYYDPELGQFLSPDTLVPDPGNLFDYNRYMYTRGNPMKYNDPTGHCTTLDDGSRDMENDAECWNLADTIATGYWSGDPEWWSARFTSPDNFMNILAGTPSFTPEYLNARVNDYLQRNGEAPYLQSPAEKQLGDWNVTVHAPGQKVAEAVITDVIECRRSLDDCGKALDDTSAALSATSMGCAMAGFGPCAGVTSGLSTAVSVAGTVITIYDAAKSNKEATVTDVIVAGITTGAGAKWGSRGNGSVGLFLSVFQWLYDH